MLFLAKMEEMSKKVSHFGRLTWIWSDEINSYKNTSCKKSQEQKLWYIIHEKCPRTIRPVNIQDSISDSWLINFLFQRKSQNYSKDYLCLEKNMWNCKNTVKPSKRIAQNYEQFQELKMETMTIVLLPIFSDRFHQCYETTNIGNFKSDLFSKSLIIVFDIFYTKTIFKIVLFSWFWFCRAF